MNVTALAPWFGGKRALAPRIVEAIGPHRCYWEPFCGSMAVLFAKPAVQMETANDLHGDLVNLARVVQGEDTAPLLYGKLARTLFSETLHAEAKDAIRTPLPRESSPCVERAALYFALSWMGMNGLSGTASFNLNFARRYTSNGGAPAKRFASAVESVPWWHERLRNVAILSTDGIELCGRIEDKTGTVIYADPPYIVKGATYLHDFTDGSGLLGDDNDHERLAQALRRFKKTRVVVSYYDHPDLVRLYPGWNVARLDVTKAMAQGGRREKGAVAAPEVLLTNNPEKK